MGRVLIWVAWTINTLCSAVFCGTSMVSFHNVRRGTDRLQDFPNKGALEGAMLASTMLGFLIVLFFMIFSFIVLLGRIFKDMKFGYGWMVGACMNTAFYTLLASLVLNSQETMAKSFKNARIWSSYDYQTYVGTYAFGYILCGTYLIFFVILLVQRSQELARASSIKYSASSPSATAGAASEPSKATQLAAAPAPGEPAAPAITGTAMSAYSNAQPASQQWGSSQGAWGHASYGAQV